MMTVEPAMVGMPSRVCFVQYGLHMSCFFVPYKGRASKGFWRYENTGGAGKQATDTAAMMKGSEPCIKVVGALSGGAYWMAGAAVMAAVLFGVTSVTFGLRSR